MDVVNSLVCDNTELMTKFEGGRLRHYVHNWREITSDKHILQTVTGYKIEFSEPPYQYRPPTATQFSEQEAELVQTEVDKLLTKGVTARCDHEAGEFISPIFLREKKDGSQRVILNLKKLNNFVVSRHLKMETLDTAVKLTKPGAWAGSLDLKDAYYSIPIWSGHTKFLKFGFCGRLYKYLALPNGLKSGPRTFTKIMRVAFSELRKRGHESVVYTWTIHTSRP